MECVEEPLSLAKTCQCGRNQFHDYSKLTCLPKKNHSEVCETPTSCREDKFLECRFGQCECIADKPMWSPNRDKCINPESYEGRCEYSSDCDPTKSLVCKKDLNENCKCPSELPVDKCDCIRKENDENYWNGFSCTPAAGFGKPCSNSLTNYMCRTLTEGTICSESGESFLCKCPESQFFNISSKKCEEQLMEGLTCYADDNCRGDLGLFCNISIGQCKCDEAMQFNWTNIDNICVSYSLYNQPCTSNDTCTGSLYCRPSNSRTSCNCPLNVQINSCDCSRSINNEFYFNGADCVPAKAYNETCGSASKSYMCKTMTEGTVCTATGSTFTCQCPQFQYYNINSRKCTSQLLNGIACSQVDACRGDLGLTCQSGTCKCNAASQFWSTSSGKCINLYTYNQGSCTDNTQCAPNLLCRTSGTTCNCPIAVTSNKCDCPSRSITSELYWNGNLCVPAGKYNDVCLFENQCKTLSEFLKCDTNAKKCVCKDSYIWSSSLSN